MNFSRKTILVVGAALLAACGDKVTVQEYTPPATTAKVNFVEVTPASVTVNTNATVTFTAAVNADAGLATTVTWTASAGTITTAGVWTAPATANPGVAICATSTVDTGKKGCAQAVVTAAAATIPATVSINSITASGNLNGTVNPAAVAGAIDVTLNVNPGNQTISKVEVLFGNIVAYTQTFTAAQAAALRYAADEAAASQTVFPQIVAPIATNCFEGMNTTCNGYKTTDVTGDAVWPNGVTALQAKVYTTASGSTQAASASVSQNLTLANVNAFFTTTSVGGTTATANNAAGFLYTRGDLTATIIPVSYNGVAAANLVVNFGAAACDGLGANPQRSKAATKSGNTFTATFANSGALAAGNLTGYSFNCAAAAVNGTGEFFSIVAATDASGNAFTTTVLPVNVGTGYRVDNLAPTVPALNFTIASVRNNLNWVNDAVPFNNTAANGGAIGTASTEVVGTGGVGLSTTNANIYTVTLTAGGSGTVTSAAGLAESLTNAAYTATATAKDLLGNTSAASVAATFGVDRTIPTFTYAGPADATAIAAPGGVLAGGITYTDPATLPAGPSTPSATPVRYTIQRRTTATASTLWNNATPAFNATGGAFSAGLAGVNVDPGATNTQAYYVLTIFVEDGAANPSASITRTYLYDITAPTGPFSIPVATASAGLSNVYTSTAGDNLDISTTQWAMQYNVLGTSAPGAAGATILLPAASFGSFASFTTSAASSADYPLFRSMTDVAAGVPVFANQGSLLNVAHTVTDRAANTVTVANAIPAANLPTLAAANPYATAGFAGTGFSVTNAAVNVDISGNGVAPTLNSVNLTATAQGTVNVMPNPFVRVDFFVYDAALNNYRLIGSATTPTVQDVQPIPGFRIYTWTVNWDPNTVGQYNNPNAAGVQNIIAIGWNSTFDAVRTAVNANITTVP